MKFRFTLLALASALLLTGLQGAMAAPRLINYQGILHDDLGEPLDGPYDLSFLIYPDSAQGTPFLWGEAHSGVPVTEGLFNVVLGALTPLDDSLFSASDERWLSVAVDDESAMRPFMRITSVPWAFRAAVADSAVATGGGGGADGDWTIDGDDLYSSVGGSVGIGTTTPDGKVHVSTGTMQMTVCDNDYDGVLTESWSAVDGHYGSNAAGYLGRREYRLTNNYYCGVLGTAEGGDGACGVMGQHTTSDNYGYFGTSEFGAYGEYHGNGNYGILGGADQGVYGLNRASGLGAFAGVLGENETSGNIGYLGGDLLGAYANHAATLNNVQMAGPAYALRAQAFAGNAAEFVGHVFVSGGRLTVDEVEILGGSDLSERFEVTGELAPGYVVSIDPEQPGQLMVSSEAYDRKVAGIISGAGGVKPGLLMGQDGTRASGSEAVALSGRVYCWADASRGPIRPGDILTTSGVPGHAMKVLDHERAQGAVIGKAMSGLEEGQGLVLVLVRPQ